MIIRPQYSSLLHLLSARGSHLDADTRARLELACTGASGALGMDDGCVLLALRLLELLHADAATWQPYRRLCLPARVPNVFSATPAELERLLAGAGAHGEASRIAAAAQSVQVRRPAEISHGPRRLRPGNRS